MDRYDVGILGGGLAGLTLAIQLRRERPDTSVLVLEKRKGPAPLAAFKVGESTVEISGHYFAFTCGLADHLDSDQLYKPGLRFYMPAGDNGDITRRVEWGAPAVPPELRVNSYQLDRGSFENHLASVARELGVELLDDARVQDVDLAEGGDDHTIRYTRDGEDQTASARWVVDAAGRAFLLKRKLGLEEPVDHTINSSWFRLGGELKLDDWSQDEAWQGRMIDPGTRWKATNHLMDTGYWVWLIPLSSGAISIGICADPRFHPYEQIKTRDAALAWLDEHEPELAGKVHAREGDIQDFLTVEDYAYGAKQVYSADRWALTGEAAAFSDPFYSPGSDYISIGNRCVADLVQRDLAGEPIEERAAKFDSMFLESFHWLLDTYTGQYELWGNPQVMSVKLIFDYFSYWGLSALRSVHGVWHDIDFYERVHPDLARGAELNAKFQAFLREWHALGVSETEGVMVNPLGYPGLLLRRIDIETELEPDQVAEKIPETLRLMEAVAVRSLAKAREQSGNPEVPADVFGSDMSLDEARELTEGMDAWLDEREEAA